MSGGQLGWLTIEGLIWRLPSGGKRWTNFPVASVASFELLTPVFYSVTAGIRPSVWRVQVGPWSLLQFICVCVATSTVFGRTLHSGSRVVGECVCEASGCRSLRVAWRPLSPGPRVAVGVLAPQWFRCLCLACQGDGRGWVATWCLSKFAATWIIKHIVHKKCRLGCVQGGASYDGVAHPPPIEWRGGHDGATQSSRSGAMHHAQTRLRSIPRQSFAQGFCHVSQRTSPGYAARLCPMQPEGGISCCGTLGISRLTSETRCGVSRKVGSRGVAARDPPLLSCPPRHTQRLMRGRQTNQTLSTTAAPWQPRQSSARP